MENAVVESVTPRKKPNLRGKIVSLYLLPEHYAIYLTIPKSRRSKFFQNVLLKYSKESEPKPVVAELV